MKGLPASTLPAAEQMSLVGDYSTYGSIPSFINPQLEEPKTLWTSSPTKSGKTFRRSYRICALVTIVLLVACATILLALARPPRMMTVSRSDNEDILSDHDFSELIRKATVSNLTDTDRATILRHYAPLVHLHPRDKWRPMDPKEAFERSTVGGAGNRTLSIPEDLWEGNEVRGDGSVRARIVGQVVQEGFHGKTYLQYWFFYPVNGCQAFRMGIWTGLKTFVREQSESFVWCPMAYHNGDWEHITIQLDTVWHGGSDPIPPPANVAFSQHSGAEWLPASRVEFTGSHPHVYAALHSHANYATEGTHKNIDDTFAFVSKLAPILTLGAVQWIQITDIADLTSNLFLYREPKGERFQRFITWSTWDEEVHDWTYRAANHGNEEDWALFTGFWGDEVDQSKLLELPSGVTARQQLYSTTTTAQKLGALNKFVHAHEVAPKGPRQHKSWYHLDFPA
ncbi:hypothetical protein HDU85_007385 [Gaertneriomyces sp. JEL0708]|nr:hypothetical protein HDU85_007385 [Gaertneriomyces sp. JEL0708]